MNLNFFEWHFRSWSCNENNPQACPTEYLRNNTTLFESDEEIQVIERKSCDNVVNSFGKVLLDMCYSFSLYILHDRVEGDEEVESTFIGQNGSIA